MARFSAAAKALRGPFKKLVQKLELKARRVAVSVSPKAAARYRDTDLHADTALKAARERAAHIRATTRKPRPRAVTAAVDRNTGRVVGMGNAAEVTEVPEALRFMVPDPSLEPWLVTNCGEVTAAARAVRGGSRLEDLVLRTVKMGSLKILPRCKNCITWAVLGE